MWLVLLLVVFIVVFPTMSVLFNDRHNVYIICGMCQKTIWFTKALLVSVVSETAVSNLYSKLDIPCGRCGSSLAGLLISHPFIKEKIEAKARLEAANNYAKEYMISLAEQGAADVKKETKAS